MCKCKIKKNTNTNKKVEKITQMYVLKTILGAIFIYLFNVLNVIC